MEKGSDISREGEPGTRIQSRGIKNLRLCGGRAQPRTDCMMGPRRPALYRSP